MTDDRQQELDGQRFGSMRTITTEIAVADLAAMADGRFGNLVKAVVDVRRDLMA